MSQSLEDAISRKLASFTAELVELYRDAVRSAMAEVVARVESRLWQSKRHVYASGLPAYRAVGTVER